MQSFGVDAQVKFRDAMTPNDIQQAMNSARNEQDGQSLTHRVNKETLGRNENTTTGDEHIGDVLYDQIKKKLEEH